MVTCLWHHQHPVSRAQGSLKKRTFGPPGGRVVTIFVDDISMPTTDDRGHHSTKQTACQLLEQAYTHLVQKPIGDMELITDHRSDWLGRMPALPCHSAV